jgi:hypothetical protein
LSRRDKGTNLFLVMQALVVILQSHRALLLSSIIFRRGVHHVARQDILPKRKAAADAWRRTRSVVSQSIERVAAYVTEKRTRLASLLTAILAVT